MSRGTADSNTVKVVKHELKAGENLILQTTKKAVETGTKEVLKD